MRKHILIIMSEGFIVRSLLKGHLKWLVSRGYKVSVLCNPGSEAEWLVSQGVDCFSVAIARQPSPVSDLKALYSIWRIVSNLSPDIVHYSTPKASLLSALVLRSFSKRVKAVYTVRGRVYENYTGITRKIFEWVERFSCRTADTVIFISKEMRESFIEEQFVHEEKAEILSGGSSNGFDPDVFRFPTTDEKRTARNLFGCNRKGPVLAFVGRIALDKGVEDFIRVSAELASQYPDINFLMVGKQEYDIGSALERFGLPADRLAKYEWLADVRQAYWAADVTLFPSFREGFGNACVESILCGTPVVCYDVIGCRESVKRNVSGILVEFRDVDALKSECIRLLEDKIERSRLAKGGSEWAVESFNQQRIWYGIDNIYQNLHKS